MREGSWDRVDEDDGVGGIEDRGIEAAALDESLLMFAARGGRATPAVVAVGAKACACWAAGACDSWAETETEPEPEPMRPMRRSSSIFPVFSGQGWRRRFTDLAGAEEGEN